MISKSRVGRAVATADRTPGTRKSSARDVSARLPALRLTVLGRARTACGADEQLHLEASLEVDHDQQIDVVQERFDVTPVAAAESSRQYHAGSDEKRNRYQ